MKTLIVSLFLFAALNLSAQQCTATTKAGIQCSRKATEAGMCWQHNQSKAPEKEKAATFQCLGQTKAGARCRNRSKNEFCHLHK